MESKALILLCLIGGATLPACASRAPAPSISTLPANALACRSEASVTTLETSGSGFQRAADSELASGRCRVFQQGHRIREHQAGRSPQFVDAASGVRFWIYRH